MDWETSKENFQPLKQGRHLTKEPKPLAKAPATDQGSAEQERKKYWKELEDYAGADPLEVWLRFIKWTQDTFKSGGHKAELLPLLERCTRELQGEERYKKDIRYLRVWIQYADLLPEPRDIFTFLKEHDIGQEFAMYYIAYAAFSELRGNFTRAEAIYQQGLERMAHPIQRLRIKHEEFQHRMERRALRKAQEGPNVGLPEDADLAPARAALNTLRSTKHRAPRPRQAPGGAGGVARPKRKGIFGPGAEPSKQSGGLEIFVDDEFKSGGRPSSPEGLPSGATDGRDGPAWAHLGTFEQTRKENVQQAGAWAGQKLKQKKALVVPAAAALDVLEDEDLAAAQAGAPGRAGAAPQGTLRQRLDAGDLQEHLRQDPLRLHKDAEIAGASSGSQMGAQAEAPRAQPAVKRKREESLAWDNSALDAGADELSFEELRGQQWLARQPQPAQGSPGGMSAEMELSSPDPPSKEGRMPVAPQLASEASDGLQAVQGSLTAAAERADQVRLGRSTSLSGSPEAGKAAEPKQATTPTSRPAMSEQVTAISSAPEDLGSRRASASVQSEMPASGADLTMATQAAFSELNGMFTSSPLGGGQQPAQAPGPIAVADTQAQQAQAAASAADVTMVTRNTFESVNSLFQGALPQNCAWPQQAPGAARIRARMSLAGPVTARLIAGEPAAHVHRAALGPEPTVTISTQAAFSTLNDMFRSDLPHEGSRGRKGQLAMQPHEAMQKRPVGAEGFSPYEDTQLLSPAPHLGHAAAAQQEGRQAMQMYEDTQFLGGHAPSPLSPHAVPQMQLYEDTQFMQENSAAMPARRADPQLTRPGSSGLPGSVGTGRMQTSGPPAAAPSPGFQLYEDTQFIGAPATSSGGAAHMQRPTASLPVVSSMGTPGVAGGHEGHTGFLAENVRPPTPAAPASDSFDSPTKNKENGGCSPVPSSQQRLLSDTMVEQGVLQDIHPAQAADLGISIADTGYERDDEDDNAMPALDRLRLEGSNVQDDFEVFSNVTARQLFHTNGGL